MKTLVKLTADLEGIIATIGMAQAAIGDQPTGVFAEIAEALGYGNLVTAQKISIKAVGNSTPDDDMTVFARLAYVDAVTQTALRDVLAKMTHLFYLAMLNVPPEMSDVHLSLCMATSPLEKQSPYTLQDADYKKVKAHMDKAKDRLDAQVQKQALDPDTDEGISCAYACLSAARKLFEYLE